MGFNSGFKGLKLHISTRGVLSHYFNSRQCAASNLFVRKDTDCHLQIEQVGEAVTLVFGKCKFTRTPSLLFLLLVRSAAT